MSIDVSRRGFLTGAAAAGALAAFGLAGCAPQAAPENAEKKQQSSSWRDKPEMPANIDETVDVDVVVIGAGNGGLVAATTAAQNGAKVLVKQLAP